MSLTMAADIRNATRRGRRQAMRAGALALLLAALLPVKQASAQAPAYDTTRDYHSYADPKQFRTSHLELSLNVDFSSKRLDGSAELHMQRLDPKAKILLLDTRNLDIKSVFVTGDDSGDETARFRVAQPDPILGSALQIEIPEAITGDKFTVRITYRTAPTAAGLQWLEPAQTAGKQHPFLFTQSEPIQIRSWIPLQDTPSVRITYNAVIYVPPHLTAVMSAAQGKDTSKEDGVYSFEMKQAIPSYLIALAVGNLQFKALSARTGVYAEPSLLEKAAKEFADTESMLATCERLFGPYRWERYDMLVLPPSFPMGGMENPRVSFITPTIIAGDRSLTSLIAHEMAHSWSGNLINNATWRDLWLNEGFTVFLERRIMGALYGQRRKDMEDALGVQSLRSDLSKLKPEEQVLAIDLRGKDPEGVFSDVPYEKGRLFLGYLEAKFGQERFDAFLRDYFNHFAFQSITTEQFLTYLNDNLLKTKPDAVSQASIDLWVKGPGLPPDAVLPPTDVFANVDAQLKLWNESAAKKKVHKLETKGWTTHEWLHFIENLPEKVDEKQLDELNKTYNLSASGNNEIAHSWFRVAIRNNYKPAQERLETYLTTIGRRKLIKPLYEDLMKTDWGRDFAKRVYAQARPGYHPLSVSSIDPIVMGTGAAK